MYTEEIKKISANIFDNVISIRRHIHKYPELGFKEFNTASTISGFLKNLGMEVRTNVAQTGVVGLLKGRYSGRTIALRADIDALPVAEQTGLEFASVNKNVMHACGHDAHIASVLGCAKILSLYREKITGNVKFIFQPGEEGLGGAKIMIDEGILDNPSVDMIIAAHVKPSLKVGKISVGRGPVMASPSEFKIIIKAHGGHAAEPHNTVDPIVIGCNIVNMLQNIITREKNPVENALLSVTSFNSGNTYNVIPDTATIKGTVRTFDPSIDKKISYRIDQITASLTRAMGADYEFKYRIGYPPVINHDDAANMIISSSKKVVGLSGVINHSLPSMLAEDFSYYLQKVPGAIFNLGCRNAEAEKFHNLHSSKLCIDEGCIKIGMEIMAQCALDFLNGN